ncbi:GTP-binding protein [Bradyrhizobium sp. Arg237L]|uniref:CobW family GTP-binding protein n=1 Tax=Bradyrhizobium sp. Arg237L TaxID=3003352 RepID=UPI00249E7E79|nr:GTP-binding protein [Bradyrhizobium sp. Arg237L]MDI4232052.1 GTP-binding protein [Bradyrhizobium sp. Arg237L]
MRRAAPIPVTVIGGFLGAGKTTFLNRLLATATARYAVLVNDFGEINVDAALIERHDGTTLSLSNGCVCCSIGSGFLETLGRLLDGGEGFERIIIEASGVGDPWRIAEIALVEPDLRLDGVIVLADATRITELIHDRRVGDTVRGQFAKCDVVLLSKSDLADEAALQAARSAIRTVRPDVPIDVLSRDTRPDLLLIARSRRSRFRAEGAEQNPLDHEQNFRRWTYRRDGVFDRTRLAAAIEALPPQLLRLKGACRVSGEVAPLVFQMVSSDWSLLPATGEDLDPASIALVGIGTPDLPSDADLEAILDGALARSFVS